MAAYTLGIMTLMSSGLLWLVFGADLPEGSFMASLNETLWGRPDTVGASSRYGAAVTNLYFPMTLFPIWALIQETQVGYLPFSRSVLGRYGCHRYLKGGMITMGALTGFGLLIAFIAAAATHDPRPATIPGFLVVLPYLIVAFPWVGVIALMGGEQFPFHLGSPWKVLGKHRAILFVSLASGLAGVVQMLGSLNELSPGGGWIGNPWAWGGGALLLILGVHQLRRSFDRFYQRIPLVPEA